MLHFGYMDPATGTLIVSALAGLFAALALMFKGVWYRAKSLLRGSQPDEGTARDDAVDRSVSAVE